MNAVTADKYYGSVAENYEVERSGSARWKVETDFVSEFIDTGPVLDVPFGTGRFVPIYRNRGLEFEGVDLSDDMLAVARRKYGDLPVRRGSIFSLPFSDNSFETAVCVRMLDWLAPEDMTRAIAELRRVSRGVVVTVRHGNEGISVNYTHSLAAFFESISGLVVEARRVTEITKHGVEEIFKLRPLTWDDVLGEFRWHADAPLSAVQRLAYEGIGRMLASFRITRERAGVSCEWWPAEKLSAIIDGMSVYDADADPRDRFKVSEAPRYAGKAITVLEYDGHVILLDGRRRCNEWRARPGLYQVFVIRPC